MPLRRCCKPHLHILLTGRELGQESLAAGPSGLLSLDGGTLELRRHGRRLRSNCAMRHEARAEDRTSGLYLKFRVDVDSFLEQYSLKQRILVSEHETFVGGSALALLKTREGFFILLDRGLKLFNVLRSPFSKGSLCLPIPLFALLRRCIYRLPSTFAFLWLCWGRVL